VFDVTVPYECFGFTFVWRADPVQFGEIFPPPIHTGYPIAGA
jgi:hypothetical protein